jgi:outer membrane protein TolC
VPASAKFPRKDGGRPQGATPRVCAIGLLVAVCMGLASCAVGPDYQPPLPPMPAGFAGASEAKVLRHDGGGNSRAVNVSRWWLALHDRELDALIERAVAASPTVEIALNRVQQARAQEAVFVGAALPQLEASEGGAFGTGSDLARGRASQTLVSAENTGGAKSSIPQSADAAPAPYGLRAKHAASASAAINPTQTSRLRVSFGFHSSSARYVPAPGRKHRICVLPVAS